MANWPTSLPSPKVEGYGFNPEYATQRTAMESGTARARRRYSTVPSRVPVQWYMSGAQLGTFESWHKHTIAGGSAWFNIDLANGLGVQSMEARFVGQPKKSALPGLYWNVSAELEVRSVPVMDSTYIEPATAYSPNDLAYSSGVLHTLINTTLPSANYW